jgi:plastocyanin
VPCAYGDAEDDGSVSEAEFRAELARGGHGAWWIRQRALTLDHGDTVSAANVGGIFHTFTEVAQFGKGCIPDWNAAVRETVDNCDFGKFATTGAAPGQTVAASAQPLSVGVHRFQCLIHPWMRSVVTVEAD